MGFGNPPTTTANYKRLHGQYNNAIARAERAEAAEALLNVLIAQERNLRVNVEDRLAAAEADLRATNSQFDAAMESWTKDEAAVAAVEKLRNRWQQAGYNPVSPIAELDAALGAAVTPTEPDWKCASCGWATTDHATMQAALWPEGPDGRVVALVCPNCHDEGNFVDYAPVTPTPQDDEDERWKAESQRQADLFHAETLTTGYLARRLRMEHGNLCEFCARPGVGVWVGPEGVRRWLCQPHLSAPPGRQRFGSVTSTPEAATETCDYVGCQHPMHFEAERQRAQEEQRE